MTNGNEIMKINGNDNDIINDNYSCVCQLIKWYDNDSWK